MNTFSLFERHLQEPGVTPEELALDVARIAYPRLEVEPYLATLDTLADYVGRRLVPEVPGHDAAAMFLRIITEDLAFHGNREDYYDPRNSLLNEVLERRIGLPVMLCLLCMALGRRLNLQVDGMGFPNHFMARYRDTAGVWLLDPFNGAVVEMHAAEAYLSSVLGRPVQLSPEALRPVSTQDLTLRILNNLRGAYLMRQDTDHALAVMGYQLLILPREPVLWRERAVLHYRTARWEQAARDLRRYFFLIGALPYLFPDEVQSAFNLPALAEEDRNLVGMHRQIAGLLNRLN